MRIVDLLRGTQKSFSFEFFPPKTEAGLERLFATMEHLAELEPSFVSVTYGAGGHSRGPTVEVVQKIKSKIGLEPMAHLTCRGHSRHEILNILKSLEGSNIENVLALRGDPPKNELENSAKDFEFASELVAFIRSNTNMCVGGACYPEGHTENPSLEDDLLRLKDKVDAGTDFLVTQLFFDNQFYFEFVKRARNIGIQVPIIPGLMPVTNFSQLKRFTEMCGATVPNALLTRLERYQGDEQAVMALGIEWAILQGRELLNCGAPGIHFYTQNRSLATRVVCVSLQQEFR